MCAGRTSSIGARLLRHRGSIEGRTLRLNNGSTTTNSPTFNTFIHASCYQNISLYYLVNVLEKGIETDPRLCIVSFPFCLPPMYPLPCLLSVYLIRFFSFQVSFLFADFIRKREVVSKKFRNPSETKGTLYFGLLHFMCSHAPLYFVLSIKFKLRKEYE